MRTRYRKTPPAAWAIALADRLEVLANPSRLEVLADLVAHPGSIAREIGSRTGQTEQAVCNNLKLLKAVGLISSGPGSPRDGLGARGKALAVTPGPAIEALEATFDLLNGEAPASLPIPEPRSEEGVAA